MKENITEQWGETVNGIIEVLEKVEETQMPNYFDPYLNEYLEKLDNFILGCISKEDKEVKKDIEKIKIDYIKKGLETAKLFMDNLFAIQEINLKKTLQRIYRLKEEIQEFTVLCDSNEPNIQIGNQEILLNLLEDQVQALETDINFKLEKEYLKIEGLKKVIRKISNNSISLTKVSQKNILEKKLETLALIIERR